MVGGDHAGHNGDDPAYSGPSFLWEKRLWNSGYSYIAGVDEAGRGALAGPVVAAAVILSPQQLINGLNDSKKLTANNRDRLYGEIMHRSLAVGVGISSNREIDTLNIWGATCLAAQRALARIHVPVQYVLMDGSLRVKGLRIPQSPLPKGDAISSSIAAASIVAKVRRDRIMNYLDKLYPLFRFDLHVGYGTRLHRSRIQEYGPCIQHRHTFEPISQLKLWD